MKYTLILLLLPFLAKAQNEFPVKDGKVVYELVDSSVKGSANDLKARAKIWFANAFRDSKEVIQFDGENSVIGKGNFQFEQSLVPFVIRFSVKIDTKDNKYRAQFYDITYKEGTMGADKQIEGLNDKKGRDKLKNNIKEKFESLLASISKAMSDPKSNDF